jgi:hypothetical protein
MVKITGNMSYMMILAGNCMDEKKWNFNSPQGSITTGTLFVELTLQKMRAGHNGKYFV